MKRVAIQGLTGSSHDMAAHQYFDGEQLQLICCATFEDVFDNIRRDPTVIGMMAIENTIAGSLLHNYELLRDSGTTVVGEHKLHISHCICCLPDDDWTTIQEVHSHPVALMQCRGFLSGHPMLKAVESEDTAGSAKDISEGHRQGQAAICSAAAARLYGMKILEDHIEDNKHNFTRFLVLADPARIPAEAGARPADKASLVFSLQHARGTLSKVLAVLSFYDLNLTKIQSLPIVGREWEYRFYVDVTFDDPIRYRQAVEAVRPLMNELKILGVYARAARIGGPADDAAAGEAGVDARITE